jgi:hypothetical protein
MSSLRDYGPLESTKYVIQHQHYVRSMAIYLKNNGMNISQNKHLLVSNENIVVNSKVIGIFTAWNFF